MKKLTKLLQAEIHNKCAEHTITYAYRHLDNRGGKNIFVNKNKKPSKYILKLLIYFNRNNFMGL